jgi:hypothetical protein
MTTNTSINTPALFNKGDLLLGQGSGLRPSVLPAGANGLVLTLDNTQPTGAKWAAGGGGGSTLSPYIVGATESDFTTIQAAIDQAVTDGASKTNQKNVYVKPGTYNENISLFDGINVLGFDPYPSEDYPGIQFPNNGFLSAVLTGTVTHSSGDSKIYNIYIKPGDGFNAFNLSAIGGLLFIRGCRFDLPTTSILLNFSNADTVVISDCISASGFGQFLTCTSTDIASVAIFSSEILSMTTSTLPMGGASIQLSNSYLYASIDASNASIFYFQAYDSQHWPNGSDPLIQIGASTNSFITYVGSQFASPENNAFIIPNSDTPVRLVNSWNISGGNNVSGGGIAFKNFITGPSGESILVKNISAGFNGTDYIFTQGGLQTSDDSTQLLASMVLNTNESITLMGNVVGAQSDHSNAVGGDFTVTARRSSGDITLIGSPIVNVRSSSTATFTVDVDTTTQSARVLVTGVAATVYNWVATLQYQKILTNA